MEPRIKIRKLAGEWWWELHGFDERLITPLRLINDGIQDTWRGAMWAAWREWNEFQGWDKVGGVTWP